MMQNPVVELTKFVSTAAFITDPLDTALQAFVFLSKVEGCSSVYYGMQEEDKKTGYIVAVWESFDHRSRHAESSSSQEYRHLLSNSIESDLKIHLIPFSTRVDGALSAPFTEVTVLQLKPWKSLGDISPALKELSIAINQLANPNYARVTWGKDQDLPKFIVLLIGWNSIQAKADMFASEEMHELTSRVTSEVHESSTVHVCFTEFSADF